MQVDDLALMQLTEYDLRELCQLRDVKMTRFFGKLGKKDLAQRLVAAGTTLQDLDPDMRARLRRTMGQDYARFLDGHRTQMEEKVRRSKLKGTSAHQQALTLVP